MGRLELSHDGPLTSSLSRPLLGALMISGSGDVIEPSDGVIGIGSGGMFAVAAARALLAHTQLPAEKIVEESLRIAADICVYTNHEISVETLE